VFIAVGVALLMSDTGWVSLLLKGIALVFLLDISNYLFYYALDSQFQEEFRSLEPMYLHLGAGQWFNTMPALRDLFGFGCLCLVVFLVAQVYLYAVGLPMSQAMECACLSSGQHCREAQAFDHHFWDRYWTQDLPDAFSTIEKLKVAHADGRPMQEINAETSQVTPRRPHEQKLTEPTPQDVESAEPQAQAAQTTLSPPPRARKGRRSKNALSPEKRRSNGTQLYPEMKKEEVKSENKDDAQKVEASIEKIDPQAATKAADADNKEVTKDESIRWYMLGHNGRHFQPRGRRRRSHSKEEMVNKPKTRDVVDGSL